MKKNMQKSQIDQEDEISLIDIIKTWWSWRYFVLWFTVVITSIFLIIAIFIPVYYQSKSIIKIASFHGEHVNIAIESDNIINDSLHSLWAVEKAKKFFGKNVLYKMLNLNDDIIFNDDAELKKIILKKLIKMAIFEKGSDLIVRSKNPEHIVKLNNFFAELLVERHNNLLATKLKSFRQQLLKTFPAERVEISPRSFEASYIIWSADQKPVKKINNKLKIIIIAFIISLSLSSFLPFIAKNIKNLIKMIRDNK